CWRPVLNRYTSRFPAWSPVLVLRERGLDTPEQAASLLGEFRLRGLRYVVLHRGEMPERLACWCQARTRFGQTWAPVVHDSPEHLVLDLADGPPELHLPAAWALSAPQGQLAREADGTLLHVLSAGQGRVGFRPIMPLRPGRYRASFTVEGDSAGVAHCEVYRLLPRPDVLT